MKTISVQENNNSVSYNQDIEVGTILPTNAQRKVIGEHREKFKNVVSVTQETNCIITIETQSNVYTIGRLGGIKNNLKK
tara:strand:+ start:1311 stop:1547 length:237 start_codon:yes stop_codon:yes gene_type:complete